MLIFAEIVAIAVLTTALVVLVIEEGKIKNSKVPRGNITEYWNGRERRQAVRIDTEFFVKYHIEKKPSMKLNGYTKDLSSSGMRLMINEKLSKGTLLLLEFEIPEPRSVIYADGRVIWGEGKIHERDEGGKRIFHTGIQFLNMKPEDRDRLTAYIEKRSDERKKTV